MSKCHAYFVRCIKPNGLKKPSDFRAEEVMEQLRYSGMMAHVNRGVVCDLGDISMHTTVSCSPVEGF